jgi:hypothetical protein
MDDLNQLSIVLGLGDTVGAKAIKWLYGLLKDMALPVSSIYCFLKAVAPSIEAHYGHATETTCHVTLIDNKFASIYPYDTLIDLHTGKSTTLPGDYKATITMFIHMPVKAEILEDTEG